MALTEAALRRVDSAAASSGLSRRQLLVLLGLPALVMPIGMAAPRPTHGLLIRNGWVLRAEDVTRLGLS
jgi:hypothetical protein